MFRRLNEIMMQDIKKGYVIFYEGYLIILLRGHIGGGEEEGMK